MCVSTFLIMDRGLRFFKKFKNVMQVDIDEVYMSIKFGGHDFFGFGDIAIFQIWPNFPFGPWGSKNRIVSKIHASRGWCENACKPNLMGVASPVSELWLLFTCLRKRPKFPFGAWTIVHGGQKIELIRISSKNSCN